MEQTVALASHIPFREEVRTVTTLAAVRRQVVVRMGWRHQEGI